MSELKALKQTPLHHWHLSHHANMAEFGGYHMPLWYETGAKLEHLSVIGAAGLFDTSHMAVVIVSGNGSRSLLQHCFSKDLARCIGKSGQPLADGRCVYGLFLNDDGTVLDDAIVSMLGAERYMVVVNAGMGRAISKHLEGFATLDVEVSDLSGEIGKIDIQGRSSALILESLFENSDDVLSDMTYFSCKGDIFSGNSSRQIVLKDGPPVLLSRTGYTGEFGFELFVEAAHTLTLWERLLDAGRSCNILPCGLAARDSLRAGALLPLSHQDIGAWLFANTPWSFVLPWDGSGKAFTKQFVGADAVLAGSDTSYTYGFAGDDPRKIPQTENTVVLDEKMEPVGGVLTCTTDMAISRIGGRIVSVATPETSGRPSDFRARGLSCGFVKTIRPFKEGDSVYLAEGKRKLKVEIRSEVRPDRTARKPMRLMRSKD